MRDYERLRKALDDLRRMLTWETYTDYDVETMRLIVQRGLADTPETSEMERLVEWLERQQDECRDWKKIKRDLQDDLVMAGIHQHEAVIYRGVLDHIRAEFGYGEGEDATE